jgi:hypothetical protein
MFMRNTAEFNRRRSVIVSMMLLIALAHIIDIGRHLQGTLFNLFKSYFSDIVLPFGFYFLLSMEEQRISVLKRWEAKLVIMFVIPSIAETCQYFGIPVLGSTFDPLDYLMYAIGATFAAIVDTQVFPRILNFWAKEKAERRGDPPGQAA